MKQEAQKRNEVISVPPALRRMALLVSICLVAACSKVTAENYTKVKTGMEYKEVTGVLGNPSSCDDVVGFKSCKWGDEKSHITVRFAGDAVIMHSAENLR
jgi:predicted transposase YbfD/YdcC